MYNCPFSSLDVIKDLAKKPSFKEDICLEAHIQKNSATKELASFVNKGCPDPILQLIESYLGQSLSDENFCFQIGKKLYEKKDSRKKVESLMRRKDTHEEFSIVQVRGGTEQLFQGLYAQDCRSYYDSCSSRLGAR